MGLPLVTAGLGGDDHADDQIGYRIPRERYELPDPGLSEAELAALRLAASAVHLDAPWGSEATVGALRKLAALGPLPEADGAGTAAKVATAATAAGESRVPLGAAGSGAASLAELGGGEAVAAAFGAIAERRRLSFAYRGEARTVDPWRLSYRRGQWYLSGFDHGRGEERMYRLDRVVGGVEAVGEPDAFARPEGRAAAPAPPWRLGDGPEVRVRVLVDAGQAPWAEASAGPASVVARHPDGAVELELGVTNRDALRSWVLGFLHHAEVLAPPEERAAFVDWLAALTAGGAR
jgi:proteasome accessory factor B